MAGEPSHPASFSPLRRWRILFSVLLSTLAVLALVIMINYLGARYFLRFSISAQSRAPLAPQTLTLLKSITNQVRVVVYYDKKEPLYDLIRTLLEEYRRANPTYIHWETVDYLNSAGAAQAVKTEFRLGNDKDLVAFESQGRTGYVLGKYLPEYAYPMSDDTNQGRRFTRELKSFRGEQYFNAKLLEVTSTNKLLAGFLMGHDEEDPRDTSPVGYAGFATLLARNYIDLAAVGLSGLNAIPTNCSLLIIAGPKKALMEGETEKIKRYLAGGGRLLVLFKRPTPDRNLETLLAGWGVRVEHKLITDKDNSVDSEGTDFVVRPYVNHPVVHHIFGLPLQMVRPCLVGSLASVTDAPGAPKVDELAFAGPTALLDNLPAPGGRIPLVVAVEKARETTRLVVVGDSTCLENKYLSSDSNCNEDFANDAVNWLLDRAQIMGGVSPRAITEYRLLVTQSQMRTLTALFLAGMPGGILALGGLVWLRRRH